MTKQLQPRARPVCARGSTLREFGATAVKLLAVLGALVGLSFLVSPFFHHPGEFFLAVDIVFVLFLLLRGVWLILRYFVP